MARIRTHKKTRTGCTQCRRRRVKCDKRKPSCLNCERNTLQCSLEFLIPITSLSWNKPITSIIIPRRSYPLSPPFGPELSPSPSPFDTQTMELLHHYTTHVSGSLSGKRSPYLWRNEFPYLALEHPFLLSGILALSALHLSIMSPHRKNQLQSLAIAKETSALPTFRQYMSIPKVENIHATFAFAGSVIFYMMVSPEMPSSENLSQHGIVDKFRLPTRNDEHPHWFLAVRGVVALLADNWTELLKGPFAPLINRNPETTFASNNPDDDVLERLEEMFETSLPPSIPLSSTACPINFVWLSSPREKNDAVCRKALDELRIISALPYAPHGAVDLKASPHIWPGTIDQDFVELIFDRNPKALVILTYYCVVLKRNNGVWYLRGLGTGLLRSIWEELGEEWRPWIQWALDQPETQEVVWGS